MTQAEIDEQAIEKPKPKEEKIERLPMYLLSSEAKESKARDVIIDHFSIAAPDGKELIHGSELRLVQGHRYGLLGKNGIGKSTLLKLYMLDRHFFLFFF